eukprot:3354997-Rhodomonas_salina.1
MRCDEVRLQRDVIAEEGSGERGGRGDLEGRLDDVLVGEAEGGKPHALGAEILHDAGDLDTVGGGRCVRNAQNCPQPRRHVRVRAQAAAQRPEVKVAVVRDKDLELLGGCAPRALGVAAPHALHPRVGEAMRVGLNDGGCAGSSEAGVPDEELALGAEAFLVGLGLGGGLGADEAGEEAREEGEHAAQMHPDVEPEEQVDGKVLALGWDEAAAVRASVRKERHHSSRLRAAGRRDGNHPLQRLDE